MTTPEPIPLNWCEDLPAPPAEPEPEREPEARPITREDEAYSAANLERVLTKVVRLAGEILCLHPKLLDEFNAGLRSIRQQHFPLTAA